MVPVDGLSQQELSDTIGLIYDCALDTELWPMTLGQLAELVESPYCGLAVQDLVNIEGSCLIDHGYPRAYCELSARYWDQNPMTPSIFLLNVGDVTTLSMTCSDNELFESRYHREVQKPFGILDMIGILGLRSGSRIAYVHSARKDDAPRFGEKEVELFRLLAPHICRALAISDVLDLKSLRSTMLEEILDNLSAAVFLVNDRSDVIYMNQRAEAHVRDGTALAVVNGRLRARDAQARSELSHAMGEACSGEIQKRSANHSVAIPASGRSGFIATLMPIAGGRRSEILAPFAAKIAIFVRDPSQAPLVPGEAFARLFGLTGGELRVILAMAQGLNAKDAADVLGIGEPTVRTHLQHVFAKTGTSRQQELLQLLQNAAAPTQS